jgi:6-phosphogluconolactonase (cycloisomerase 2 family)
MRVGGLMKKVNKFKYKRVRLYWQDIVSNPEWLTLSKAKDQVYSFCEDTGYLLHKDQKKVIIFASHSFDDDGELTVGNTTVYPRSVVKKIEVLK